jgi:hypothetical protein
MAWPCGILESLVVRREGAMWIDHGERIAKSVEELADRAVATTRRRA